MRPPLLRPRSTLQCISIKIKSIAWPSPLKVKLHRFPGQGLADQYGFHFRVHESHAGFPNFHAGFWFWVYNEIRLYSYQWALPNINVSDTRFLMLLVSTSCYFFVWALDTCLLRIAPFLAKISRLHWWIFSFFYSGSCSGIFSQEFSLNRQPNTSHLS